MHQEREGIEDIGHFGRGLRSPSHQNDRQRQTSDTNRFFHRYLQQSRSSVRRSGAGKKRAAMAPPRRRPHGGNRCISGGAKSACAPATRSGRALPDSPRSTGATRPRTAAAPSEYSWLHSPCGTATAPALRPSRYREQFSCRLTPSARFFPSGLQTTGLRPPQAPERHRSVLSNYGAFCSSLPQ